MKQRTFTVLALMISIFIFERGGLAQTTLSGDHIITGDLNVGTSGGKGNLTVTGDTGTGAAPGINVTGDGGVVFGGTYGTGSIPASGDGTRFMWYPKKGALRAGTGFNAADETDYWAESSIGSYSTSLGYASSAVGYASTAFGSLNHAAGANSVAIGYGSSAEGENSIAMGDGGRASGSSSLAMGFYTSAEAPHSLAWGVDSHAFGAASLAFGDVAIASGTYSAAFGELTAINSFAAVVIGQYNRTIGSFPTSWESSDPLFVIGNGEAWFGDPSDAFVVYKNGNVTIPKRQGDILMGEFGNPE